MCKRFVMPLRSPQYATIEGKTVIGLTHCLRILGVLGVLAVR
ncbi:hypothetical protein [Nostoc commune]|nr:hypothetical protein [Nostoc commune]